MRTVFALAVLLAVAVGASAEQDTRPDIDEAIKILEQQVARDAAILEKPKTNANTKKARNSIKAGLGGLQFVMDQLNLAGGGEAVGMVGSLTRILDEEKKQSEISRLTNRYKTNLRNMITRNLPMKRSVLKRLQGK